MKKTIKIITILLIIISITMLIPKSLMAGTTTQIKPSDITGEHAGNDKLGIEFQDKLIEIIRTIGVFMAVGVLMVIGIKYISGSIEEKAQYKKSMLPYIIGCVILFGASTIAPEIVEIFKENDEIEDIGNIVLGIIKTVGSFVAVGTIMVLGIKYMMGSLEQRAEYKKSMIPLLIGCVILFGAVNITAMIANEFGLDKGSVSQGIQDANDFLDNNGRDPDKTTAEINRVTKLLEEERMKSNPNKSLIEKYEAQLARLQEVRREELQE